MSMLSLNCVASSPAPASAVVLALVLVLVLVLVVVLVFVLVLVLVRPAVAMLCSRFTMLTHIPLRDDTSQAVQQ